MKKAGKVIGCLMPLFAALACQYVMVIVCSGLLGVVLTIQMMNLGITDVAEQEAYLLEKSMDADTLMVITAIATLATLLVGVVWYRKHKPENDFNLKEVMNVKLFTTMLCLGLSLQILISLCLNAVFPILPQTMINEYSELMETLIDGNIVLSLFVTVVLAPLAEELLFRGVTLKKAQKIMPFMAANILQALLFGVYHMNLIQGVYAFVIGLILGFTAGYFHSLWASVLLHAAINGSAEIISNIPESIIGTMGGIVAIAVVGIVLLLIAGTLFPKAKKQQIQKFNENLFDEQ